MDLLILLCKLFSQSLPTSSQRASCNSLMIHSTVRVAVYLTPLIILGTSVHFLSKNSYEVDNVKVFSQNAVLLAYLHIQCVHREHQSLGSVCFRAS